MMKDKAYEAIGPSYRFFLAWRHAAFAGGLVILWGTCSLLTSAHEKGLTFAWLIPFLASLAAFSLWLADRRTRQIYRSLTEAGRILEEGNLGPYHALTDIGIPKDAKWFPSKDKPLCKFFSQSFALDFFFLGSALILLAVALFVMIRPPNVENLAQSPNQGVPHGILGNEREVARPASQVIETVTTNARLKFTEAVANMTLGNALYSLGDPVSGAQRLDESRRLFRDVPGGDLYIAIVDDGERQFSPRRPVTRWWQFWR